MHALSKALRSTLRGYVKIFKFSLGNVLRGVLMFVIFVAMKINAYSDMVTRVHDNKG